MIQISMNTDYLASGGGFESHLESIATAGFTSVHWCHEWGSDHLYSLEEIKDIKKSLNKHKLKIHGIHASDGVMVSKHWGSSSEDERLGGVKLVKNRITMAHELETDIIVIHIPDKKPKDKDIWMPCLNKSLDEIESFAVKKNIRIAIENSGGGNLLLTKEVIEKRDPAFLGFCYDTGHGNMSGQLDLLTTDILLQERLCYIHIHDNDGINDEHKHPFSGTVDWKKLARLINDLSYKGQITVENFMYDYKHLKEDEFLKETFETSLKFSKMIETLK